MSNTSLANYFFQRSYYTNVSLSIKTLYLQLSNYFSMYSKNPHRRLKTKYLVYNLHICKSIKKISSRWIYFWILNFQDFCNSIFSSLYCLATIFLIKIKKSSRAKKRIFLVSLRVKTNGFNKNFILGRKGTPNFYSHLTKS